MVEELKRIGLRLTDEYLEMVDSYRKDLPGVPDRTNAIREMIKVAYELKKENQSQG